MCVGEFGKEEPEKLNALNAPKGNVGLKPASQNTAKTKLKMIWIYK
jgi:hypothetical protein